MILIVDDDRSVTASLALLLKQAGLPATAAASPDEALDVLRRQPCQLIIQDMNFSRRTSGEEGLALLRQIKDATPSIPVVLITAWGSIGLAVEGMKAGASVLITGESGTGKELVAEAVHRNSRRAGKPFVKVNLGGVPATLFESEMFGHVRGAFTDARADRKGRFETANGGTIFLDEIGDLDQPSQVKMLRVLQDRTFEVLGSSQRREVDVRVVTATNRGLADMVARGEFREDLLYRINLLTIHLPPLRERPDDIPVLASRFLQTAGQVYRRAPLTLTDAARRWLRAQPWPGNVRQLRQSVERAVLVSTHDRLEVGDFADSVAPVRAEPGADALPPVGSMTMDEIERAMIVKSLRHHGGNVSKVAESLGLSRAALYRRFEKYEIPRVNLRRRAVAYLVVLHAMFAGLAVYLLLRNPFWLLAIEAIFVVSLAVGLRLSREMYRQFGLAAEGLRLIRDEEFTSRFLPVGQPEIDEMIGVYNRMVDHLRGERVRLAEQHQFLSQVLQVPSGVVILDFDRHVSSLNPAAERLLGRPASAVVGRGLDALGFPLGDALASLGPGEARLIGLLGARRVKCHHGTFVDRGFMRSFLLVEELTEELRQFERKAYEKLIRVMSHEVNNTVTASNSLLHSSLTYAADIDPANRHDFEQAIGIVIDRTEQLSSFMRRFADVFRLPPPLPRPCDLVAMLENIVRLLGARTDAAGITWRWELDDPSVLVAIDRGQMEQALLNILKNAMEAVEGDGAITVRLTSRSAPVTLTIEDSGPGMTLEALSNLFTPFFSTKPNGQGIGLTLVQEILAGHGFHYALERTVQGTTRFTIVMSGQGTSALAPSTR